MGWQPEIETRSTICSACGSSAFTIAATSRDYIYHGTVDTFSHALCADCGHIYLNPQPTITQLPLMYPPNYGTFSNRFRVGASLLGRVKIVVNLKRIKGVARELPQNGAVLDVGCGNGELLLALRQLRPDLELFGLDWHFPTETRQALEGRSIHLIESPLESADLPARRFELILMLQLIEHLWEPEDSVGHLVRALAVGGRILIETPNTDGWDRRFFTSGTWGGYYAPRHLNLYNFKRLAMLLRRAGLTVVSQHSLPAPLIWCYSLQGAVQEHVGWKSPLRALFGVSNLPLIAAFAALDVGVIALGGVTSNQQAIAKKL